MQNDIHKFQIVNTDWDLVDLRVFCQVARRSSFLAAATELGISPAYVSKRIAHLEHALGVTLINRTTRRVRISDAGELAYAWACKVLEAADGLGESVALSTANLAGSLRISSSLRLGRNHLSPILASLHRLHPQLDIWLELLDRRADLLADGLDIDVRIGEVHEPNLVPHFIAKGSRVLCASPEYFERNSAPRSLADLAGHNCLLYRERHQTFGTWRLMGPRGIETIKVTGAMGSNHSDIVRNWALDGRGISLLADWDIADALESGKLVRVLSDYRQQADVWATTAAGQKSSPKVRACIQFIVEHLQQGPHALRTMP